MSIAPTSSSAPMPAPAPAAAAGTAPQPAPAATIDPQLAALVQRLPPEQQQAALAKLASLSPAEQQQLATQIAAQQSGGQTASTGATTPGAAPAQAGSGAIDPRLAALLERLPADQRAGAAAAIAAMTPEQQQQLVSRITAGQLGGQGAGPAAQAQAGAQSAQPPAEAQAGAATPAPRRRVYEVRPGDNLSVIAARYGLTWQELYRANRRRVGRDPDLIHPGLRLVIPEP